MLDAQSGFDSTRPAKAALDGTGSGDGSHKGLFGNGSVARLGYLDSGGASRFFFRADYDESEIPT